MSSIYSAMTSEEAHSALSQRFEEVKTATETQSLSVEKVKVELSAILSEISRMEPSEDLTLLKEKVEEELKVLGLPHRPFQFDSVVEQWYELQIDQKHTTRRKIDIMKSVTGGPATLVKWYKECLRETPEGWVRVPLDQPFKEKGPGGAYTNETYDDSMDL
jgi:hypothetical protein